MAIQSTRIEVPDGVEVYVFGSAMNDIDAANDVDILFIYDTGRIAPSRVYGAVAPISAVLSQLVRKRVHPVVLTILEEESDTFRSRVTCVPLRDWLGRFEQRPSKSYCNDV